jgi:taurine dioxygenase
MPELPLLIVRRLGPGFAAEVRGCDVTAASENPARFAELLDLFHAHRVLVFPGQDLAPREMLRFAHLFGEIRPHPDQRFCVPDCPEVMLIGNLKEDGEYRSLFVNSREEWHADLTYTATPNKATMLYALDVPPEGGDTLFADMVAAYDSLDEGMRAAIEGRGAIYDYVCMDAVLREHDPGRPPLTAETKRALPPVTHPLAPAHPATGQRSLYLSPEVISHVEGMGAAESKAFVARLLAHATQDRHVYRHRWRVGDLVLWDNRCTNHSATTFDDARYLRLLYRCTVEGERPV